MTNTEFQIPETNENFEALLNEQFGDNGITGSVVKGTIVRVTPDFAIVDVGLKSEGRIPLREFGQNAELKAGDKVEVYVDRYEDKDGQIVLSREKARREEVWQDLEKSLNAGERVNGVIFGRVKGGFTVDLNGAIAFLPGSQIDIRPIRDITPLMGISQPFQILKMDKVRGNIVVSRRVVLEETRAEARAELIDTLKEGSILEGVVKTSPITAHSLIWAVLTACCTLPTFLGNALITRAKFCPSVRPLKFRLLSSMKTTSVFLWA